MIDINKAEKKALRIIFTDYTTDYNGHTIKDKLGMSHRYSIDLLKSLMEKKILTSKQMGKATFYKTNLQNSYVIKLLELIFTDNTDQTSYVKGWIKDLESFKADTKAVLLFGSILPKGKNARDVDVSFVLKNYNNLKRIKNKIGEINNTHKLKIHPLYITEKDFIRKLKKGDKPLISIVKICAVVHGQETFVDIVKNVQS